MKGLYITLINILQPGNLGITKVKGQINAFEKLGYSMDWVYEKNLDIYINDIKIGSRKNNYIGVNKFFDIVGCNIEEKYDFVYIRYMVANVGLLKLVRKLKKIGIRIIVEIPTYPYLTEINKNIRGRIICSIDKYITNNLHKYVDNISVTNDIEKLFNIETIKINNAVDVENVKPVANRNKKDTINMIAIANIERWHGYDRLIEGISEYYKNKTYKKNVKLYIVGNGNKEIKDDLINRVKKYKLENYIIFTGVKNGDELDKLYEKIDIGISSLSLNRAGGGHDPVKAKEYIAKGIPVVMGYEDRLIPSTNEFIYKVEDDDSKININSIIEWYINLKNTNEEIRIFAEENLCWTKQIAKIVYKL